MTREQALFLSLLRDRVCGICKAKVPKDLNWDILYSYGAEQSLLSVCYLQLKALKTAGKEIPADVLERFLTNLAA